MGAPHTLLRVPLGRGRCAWCGSDRKTLYGYAGESSGGWRTKEALRSARGGKGFCDTSCFRAYHDIGRRDYDYVDSRTHRENPDHSPRTGQRCSCKRGVWRDNCPNCEGTGWVIDFQRIHRERREREDARKREDQTRRNPPSGKAGDYLADLLKPSRFPNMSPKMGAILGYILDQDWVKPTITNAVVTSDGYVMIWTKDRPDKEGLFSTIADLRDNLSRLAQAADLSANERKTLERLFRERVPKA